MVRCWSVLATLVVVSSLVAGCSRSEEPAPAKTVAPTPIDRLDAAGVRLARVEFCDRVAKSAVTQALGGPAEGHDAWGNGDPAPTDGTAGAVSGEDTGDVTHELGCAWTGAAGAAARAWVFARPVTAEFAATLLREAGRRPGCKAESTPAFGSPALLQTCTLPGGLTRIRRAGLFSDTWLTCEVSGAPAPDLRARADAWCSTAVSALDLG